jgi:predicted acylesterase/phospholipase RssA
MSVAALAEPPAQPDVAAQTGPLPRASRRGIGLCLSGGGFRKELTPLRLREMPERPEFLFLATDMAYGVSFTFARDRMGDYQAGYMPPPEDFPVGKAVAASACFPPLFDPMRLRLDPDFHLTDGGDYDNMGLEPVWKSHAVVLVSDAGGLFTGESDKGLLWRIFRYQGIQERQARALRKRWLISSFNQDTLDGTYWSVASAPSQYEEEDRKEEPRKRNGRPFPPAAVPHPDWFPPDRSEDAIRAALKDSGKRKTWGRG